MLSQVSLSFVRLLCDFWQQQGVPRSRLIEVLGYDIESPPSYMFGVGSHKVALLYECAVEVTSDPLLGARAGINLATQDCPLLTLVETAPTLLEGIDAFISHVSSVSEAGRLVLTQENDDTSVLAFQHHSGLPFTLYQHDMILSSVAQCVVSRSRSGEITYCFNSSLAGIKQYQGLMAIPVEPHSTATLRLSNALLVRENPSSDSVIFNQVLKKLRRFVEKRMNCVDLYYRANLLIKENLLNREVSQYYVAQKLNISVRNMQRKLKELGCSYQYILDQARKEQSIQLIEVESLPLYEIAFLIGYAEPSAFYKAFKRWTGERPGDYRQKLINKNQNISNK